MTDYEKLSMLRTMTDGDDSDEVLSTYLKLAASKILSVAYPYDDSMTEIPVKYEMVQLEIATYLLNKRGAEFQTSHTENGITRNYGSADVPSSILNKIVPHIGVIK